MHQPLKRMGEEAASLVIRLADETPATTPRMDLATSLVVRDSTAPPAEAAAPAADVPAGRDVRAS